ncbi:formate dehydrogenase family accessory protein FdhD [Priestia megaterium DSM 319]|uniref:Sulfur carrier protein FdhD n=2 Tax=Priestia megaterium TaxID=1404 RepID=D5DN97_PRIM3|nr:formate dehydrogenase accessory sulfurtransferase FdhD [Priestia megaterium]ADF41824.1 formate dehydrogenase family accessory protein FdhD [Priestia megaterium DSM 319]MED4218640.1 formate dehydrogenase accessory sulfurtransferase FdhD [Priestia megaterium]WEZ40855.1 formate dehydrogenase accessory sulfurtransferase FdhD [Priestia megaterium DSM 319]
MNSTVKKRTVLRFKNGQMESVEDKIVTEFPVTVKINEEEFVTMVCSPQYIEDMVIGYLASEGVIRAYTDIKNIWIQQKEGYVHVTIDKLNPYFQNLQNKRYITSCCGASRQGFVFINDALTAKKMNDISVELSIKDCFQLMNKLQQSAATFQETGGVHNAAICDKNGFMLSRMDIGRHNALDKLYGYCLKHHISIRDKVVVFSGRISSEILLKVAKIGCEVVLSKSAPTELALNLAEELGITTVGFIRNDSLNIYTCPERILRES